MIERPRALLTTLAALFSVYHVVLGVYALHVPERTGPVMVAMAVYLGATLLSLWPAGPVRMPRVLAFFILAVCVALPLLVGSQLDGARDDNGYATWYVAAIGTLLTITATRKRGGIAWLGVLFLVGHTLVWAGPGALGPIGVIGSAVWVAAAVLMSRALAKAGRDAAQFGRADMEATRWQAAQEAHLYERTVRLAFTNRMALPMLRRIMSGGDTLDDAERLECRFLEAAIRDEIRGRRLLNDAVRHEVMVARRRGAIVTLLDEGGIDDLDAATVEDVLHQLAAAIRGSAADTIIARTATEATGTAVTVVGLCSVDPSVAALGLESSGDEVELWREIPRVPTRAGQHAG
ncbi:MAG: hypothetical protein R6W83_12865 [Cryobacterium sp.]